jgi:hypothetical protein
LSPAKFRHVSSVKVVKARANRRSSSRKPKAAKAAVRARARGKKAPRVAKKAPRKPQAAAARKTKPAATKPLLAKTTTKARVAKAAPKPVAAKPVAAKPVAAKPVAAKPVAAKPAVVVAKPAVVVAKPVPPKATPAKAAPAKAAPPAPSVPPSAPPPKKPARKSIKEAAGVSTDAVARRTGKSWDDWFDVLDSAGAATLDQRGVIAILAQKHGIGPWWQQMIAVGYESVRGKSDRPPANDGFRINSSCTLDAPLPRVFRLWNDAGERARWLADDRFVVRGATADKSIRARWGKGTSHVAVSFSEKSGRTEVSVEHHQIESSAAAEQMKAYWAKKLGLLEALAPRR